MNIILRILRDRMKVDEFSHIEEIKESYFICNFKETNQDHTVHDNATELSKVNKSVITFNRNTTKKILDGQSVMNS